MGFLIWGTGNIAEQIWREGICCELLLGFVETERRKTEYKGYPVYDIDTMPDKYDYIIVANTYSDEIYDICIERNIDMDKVVFIVRGKHTKYVTSQAVKTFLGEKNCIRYARGYQTWKGTFFEDDIRKYEELNTRDDFKIKEEYLYPWITDKHGMNGGMEVYFWQDLWAAKYIISEGVKEHYDIGSRVDGFIAHLLAANIKVNMIDIRPFPGEAENLYTIVDDATMMNQFEDNSISSLSALCSLEHFGLGRYGDPIDPEACFKCFVQIQKKIKPGGKLYISLPIGQDRVEFNAHRIYYASTIISCFNELKLIEYSVINNKKIESHVDIHKYDDCVKTHVTGLFLFEKPFDKLGTEE